MADPQGNVSYRSIYDMLSQGGDWHFAGLDTIHQQLLLWTAIDTVACLLDPYYLKLAGEQNTTVSKALTRVLEERQVDVEAQTEDWDIRTFLLDILKQEALKEADTCGDRFSLNGDGHRYFQVGYSQHAVSPATYLFTKSGLAPTRGVEPDKTKIKRTWFSSDVVSDSESICPSCAIVGMAHFRKTFSGYGRKTSGTWKNATQFFPSTPDIAETLLRGALAWGMYSYEDLTYGDKDPWRDPDYLSLFSTGDTSTSFRSIRHLRSWTAWGMKLNWQENVNHNDCAICGQDHPFMVATVNHPGKSVSDEVEEEEEDEDVDDKCMPGKKIWPKIPVVIKGVPTGKCEFLPSPFMLLAQGKQGWESAKISNLAEYAEHMFEDKPGFQRPYVVGDILSPRQDVVCFKWSMVQDEIASSTTLIPLHKWRDRQAELNIKKMAKIINRAQITMSKAKKECRIKKKILLNASDTLDANIEHILSTWIQGVSDPNSWEKKARQDLLHTLERHIQSAPPSIRAEIYKIFNKF